MVIETLILCALSAVAAYIIGSCTSSSVCTKHKGWKILTWKGNSTDKYYIYAEKNDTFVYLTLKSDGTIDFDYWCNKNYGKQR